MGDAPRRGQPGWVQRFTHGWKLIDSAKREQKKREKAAKKIPDAKAWMHQTVERGYGDKERVKSLNAETKAAHKEAKLRPTPTGKAATKVGTWVGDHKADKAAKKDAAMNPGAPGTWTDKPQLLKALKKEQKRRAKKKIDSTAWAENTKNFSADYSQASFIDLAMEPAAGGESVVGSVDGARISLLKKAKVEQKKRAKKKLPPKTDTSY